MLALLLVLQVAPAVAPLPPVAARAAENSISEIGVVGFEPGSTRRVAGGDAVLERFTRLTLDAFGDLSEVDLCSRAPPGESERLQRRRMDAIEAAMRRSGIRYISQTIGCDHDLEAGDQPVVWILSKRLFSEKREGADVVLIFGRNSTRLDRAAQTEIARFSGAMPPSDLVPHRRVQICAARVNRSASARADTARRVALTIAALRRAGVRNAIDVDDDCQGGWDGHPLVHLSVSY